jgi:hypothetical protein
MSVLIVGLVGATKVARTGNATLLKVGAVGAEKEGAVSEGALGAEAVAAAGAVGRAGKVGAAPGAVGSAGSVIVGAVMALGTTI